MWKKSFEFLKGHLSPETVEKYGPPPQSVTETEKSEGAQPEPAAEAEGESSAASGGK